MISAIITAAGKNRRMMEDLRRRGLEVKNKLLLDIHEKSVIEQTVENVLETEVDECIIVLGHFSDEILPILKKIEDERIKVIKNPRMNVELSESLLNGIENVKSDFCLCVAADQPTLLSDTLKKLIDEVVKSRNPENFISILARGKSGYLDSAKGLGMPFVCNVNLLKKYLVGRRNNLNPILKDMINDGVVFYGVLPRDDLELVNINGYDDYLLVLSQSDPNAGTH